MELSLRSPPPPAPETAPRTVELLGLLDMGQATRLEELVPPGGARLLTRGHQNFCGSDFRRSGCWLSVFSLWLRPCVTEGSRADVGVLGGLLLAWGPTSSPEGSTIGT